MLQCYMFFFITILSHFLSLSLIHIIFPILLFNSSFLSRALSFSSNFSPRLLSLFLYFFSLFFPVSLHFCLISLSLPSQNAISNIKYIQSCQICIYMFELHLCFRILNISNFTLAFSMFIYVYCLHYVPLFILFI